MIEKRPKKFRVELMKPGSAAGLATADVTPTVSVTSPLVVARGGGLTMVDGVRACSKSRRAKASRVHAAGDCTGTVGALLANGDRTALTTVDTRPDKGLAGVGVTTVDAGAITAGAALEDVGAAVIAATGAAAADGVVDANDGR